MGPGRTDEFHNDAVRRAQTSGMSRRQVADDLGVGVSTLNDRVTTRRGTDVLLSEDRTLARETERLRRKNRVLRKERDTLKIASGRGPLVRSLNSLCYAAPEGQLPMAYRRVGPR